MNSLPALPMFLEKSTMSIKFFMLHEFYFCFQTGRVEFYILTSIARSRNNIYESGGRDDRENLRILGICGTPGDNVGSAFLWIIESPH